MMLEGGLRSISDGFVPPQAAWQSSELRTPIGTIFQRSLTVEPPGESCPDNSLFGY